MTESETETTTGQGPLAQAPAVANLTTTDLDRSKAFYTKTLGMTLAMEMGSNAFLVECGQGTHILVYVRDEAPRATNTVVSFNVQDLRSVVDALGDRGVTFEDYDMPGLKTKDGIADDGHMRAAWFKDPDGNIVGLFETGAA